jgi:hypothetical protein
VQTERNTGFKKDLEKDEWVTLEPEQFKIEDPDCVKQLLSHDGRLHANNGRTFPLQILGQQSSTRNT